MKQAGITNKQTLKVWLDDERSAPSTFDVHVKTPEEAIDLLKTNRVEYISLDHDLGLEPDTRNGYMVAKFIEEAAYNGTLDPLSYNVHSANPTGRDRMIAALMQADKFWSSRRDNFTDKKASTKEVSMIAVSREGEDNLLMGIRNREQKWTLPGGHVDKNESPKEAAIRELKEETNITATEDDLQAIGTEEVIQTGTKDTPIKVHSFTLTTDATNITSKYDPDNEVGTWEWVEVQNGLPDSIRAELHNIDDVTLNQLGLIEPLEKQAMRERKHQLRVFEIATKDMLRQHRKGKLSGKNYCKGLRRLSEGLKKYAIETPHFNTFVEQMEEIDRLVEAPVGQFDIHKLEDLVENLEPSLQAAREDIAGAFSYHKEARDLLRRFQEQRYKDPTSLNQMYENKDNLDPTELKLLHQAILHGPLDEGLVANLLLDPNPTWRQLGEQIKQIIGFEEKHSSIQSFTKTSANMKGEPLPDTSALPQEQTFTYPYDEGNPKLIDRNYNGGNILKRKEMERKIKKLKELLERSK